MTVFGTNINVTLADTEQEEYVIPAGRLRAVRVDFSGTGSPYDIDITTAPFHPDRGGYGAQNYNTALPNGAITINDANDHVLGARAIDQSVAVVITNNAGQEERFTGSINTLGVDSNEPPELFMARGTGDSPTAVLDGALQT